MIDIYEFGSITIDGKTYLSDVLVYPERVDDRWWRQKGHHVGLEDLDQVLGAHPDTLVVGTGYWGRMQIDSAVPEALKKEGIALVARRTKEACEEYNRLMASQKVVAALHLTC
jgi:hypothetical protein